MKLDEWIVETEKLFGPSAMKEGLSKKIFAPRLLMALKKCREQRDFYGGMCVEDHGPLEIDDTELLNILTGEGET